MTGKEGWFYPEIRKKEIPHPQCGRWSVFSAKRQRVVYQRGAAQSLVLPSPSCSGDTSGKGEGRRGNIAGTTWGAGVSSHTIPSNIANCKIVPTAITKNVFRRFASHVSFGLPQWSWGSKSAIFCLPGRFS